MRVNEVPQEGNATLAGVRKAVYACDDKGQIINVASKGWEVEQIVTQQAVDLLKMQEQAALQRAKAGLASPLEYWMYAKRMDITLLAQSSGVWKWRVRRHLRPALFAKLSNTQLRQYADALGMPVEHLKLIP